MRAREEARARQGRRSLRGMRGGHGASAVTSLTRHSPRATRDDSARGTRTRAGPQWRGARTSIMLSGPPPPPLSAPCPPPPKSMRTQVEPDPLLTSVRAGSTYPVAQPSRPSSRSPQRDIMAGDLAELAGHVAELGRFRARSFRRAPPHFIAWTWARATSLFTVKPHQLPAPWRSAR